MKIKSMFLLTLLVLVALAACAPAPTPVPTAAPPTAAPKPTTPPEPTKAPTTAPASSSASSAASSVASGPTATRPPATATATPRPPAVTAAPGAIKVNFWHHLSAPEQVDMVQKFADEFNAKNPKYYIVPSFQGTTSEMPRKVNAAITAGSTPDMVTGNPGDLFDYATAGAMVALDSYIKDPADGLDPALLAEMSFKLPNGQELFFDIGPDGKTYGLSVARSMNVMYYNADMLKAAGFNNPPATWDEFDKICAAVTKGDQYCYPATASSMDTSAFASWVFSRGGTYASADEKKATFDDQAGIDTLKWLQNMAKTGWGKVPSVTSRGDQADFGNGKVAFAFGSTAGLPFFQDAVNGRKEGPFQWSIAPIPAGPKGKQVVNFFGPSIGIMKTTADKQKGAWLFLRYLLQKENQAEWALRLVYYPASKSARDYVLSLSADQVKATNARVASVFDQFKKGASFVSLGLREPTAAAWQGPRTTIATMLTAVFTGKSSADFTATDPEAAAKEGVQRVNKILESYGK